MARGVFRRRIRQPRRRFVHTVAASNDRTVSTTAATWTWNANAATISRDRGVNTTAATWSWSANAATVSKGRNVETTAATWSWTANAASIQFDRTVATTAGTWSWNANAASITTGLDVQTTPATWSWTANAATITRDLIVTTTAATWTWNAQESTVTRGDEPQPEPEAAKPDGAPYRPRSRRSRYPRRVSIEGRLYWVNSAEEERELLRQWQERVEAEALQLALDNAPKREIARAKVKVVRAARRVEKVDSREADWLERLKEEDDEIIALLLH